MYDAEHELKRWRLAEQLDCERVADELVKPGTAYLWLDASLYLFTNSSDGDGNGGQLVHLVIRPELSMCEEGEKGGRVFSLERAQGEPFMGTYHTRSTREPGASIPAAAETDALMVFLEWFLEAARRKMIGSDH